MTPDGREIPITEDDQGEGWLYPLTYAEDKDLRLEESRQKNLASIRSKFNNSLPLKGGVKRYNRQR